MAKLMSGTQSSLLLPQLQPHVTLPGRGLLFVNCKHTNSSAKSRNLQLSSTSLPFSQYNPLVRRGFNIMVAPVSSASNLDIEPPREVVDMKPDTTNGSDDGYNGGDGNDGGSRGGSGGSGNDDSGNKGEEGSDDGDAKKNKALLMSQKLTLAYAALVGLGGLMGYLKSGSFKSLQSGGLAALILLYVYVELPKRAVFASAVGLGLSAALLFVMGSRYKKSGKVFPAGVISLVSFIMTGGYIHGTMKTSH